MDTRMVETVVKLLCTPRCVLCKEPLVGLDPGNECYCFGRIYLSPPSNLAICPSCMAEIHGSILCLEKETEGGGNRCSTCGIPLISEIGMCVRCRERVYRFSSHRSIFLYRGTLRSLIRTYKFSGERNLSSLFAFFTAGSIFDSGLEGIPLVPIPPRRGKKRRSGWEHVEEITRELHHRYRLAIVPLLERRGGQAQKYLDFEGRRANMRGKISLRKKNLTKNKTSPNLEEVILFDDVFTTGATIDECAAVLLQHGVVKVHAITLAMD